MEYRLVLGLEIHMHVKTAYKMFAKVPTDIYDAAPNTRVSPVCIGLPGALPVPNKDAIRKTQMLGMALGCSLNQHSRFDRKHYFYPDLAKGYQISQYKLPFCGESDDGIIERIHLEEDTAKSFHKNGKTLIDFNKAGMPLIELVTKPVFTSAKQAGDFARQLRDLVRYLGISDADMEKGQLRVEPNISVRTVEMEENNQLPSYKVEVKNINSFKYMEKAIEYEFERQSKILRSGKTPPQENRGWDEKKNVTVAQRSKEDAQDYRYMPEPDIPEFYFSDDYFKELQAELPKLPEAIKEDLTKMGVTDHNASMLTKYPGLTMLDKFFKLTQELEPNKAANLLLNKPEMQEMAIEEILKQVKDEQDKISDASSLELIINEVITENPDPVEQYKAGKETVLKFLVGQVMKKTKGKADAMKAEELLKKSL